MIQNAYVGMKVRVISYTALEGRAFNHEGVITEVALSGLLPITVRFQECIRSGLEWCFGANELAYVLDDFTPEEKARQEDQKRRQEHAERYL